MLIRALRVTEKSLRHTPSHVRPLIASEFAFEIHLRILRQPIRTRTSAPNPGRDSTVSRVLPSPLRSSTWPLFFLVGGTLVVAVLLDPYLRSFRHSQAPPFSSPQALPEEAAPPVPIDALPRTPAYSEMPLPPGHLGNLTPEQELKLRDFWSLTLKIFGVKDPSLTPAAVSGLSISTPSISEPNTDSDSPKSAKKSNSKKRHSLFNSKKHHDEDTTNTSSTHSAAAAIPDEDDKYGQTKEFQQTLKEMSPEELRSAFWSMVKSDHPDALLLRFLRARKWDSQRALVMLISTMRWRSQEIHVDDDIMRSGEGGALADSKGGDAFAKREGEDFLAQIRKGKSFLHGVDREGRPLCFVRVRLHKQGEQSERAMERYIVFVIETARLVLRPPVETATIIFDMTSFTLSNMDYAPLRFMIKIFEANYPESLGAVLVHKSPWVFQGIWSIVKGWLDPVVAAKVHFTKSVEDLEVFIPRGQIVRELGGGEEWDYRYEEPVEGENEMMKDVDSRKRLEAERATALGELERKTFEWISRGSNDAAELARERDELARRLNENYWALDPYIRARTLYDRQGMIGRGGVIDFYPDQKGKTTGGGAVNGVGKGLASDVD